MNKKTNKGTSDPYMTYFVLHIYSIDNISYTMRKQDG